MQCCVDENCIDNADVPSIKLILMPVRYVFICNLLQFNFKLATLTGLNSH